MSDLGQPILLVEDDPNDVLLIRRAFERAGIETRMSVATDGDDAVFYLSGNGKFSDRLKFPMPQLVLLDLKLPKRSGFEVLQWVRKQSGIRKLPVVVLTSSSQDHDINLAYELGANSYVVKPLTFDSLLELVRAVRTYWLTINETPDLTN